MSEADFFRLYDDALNIRPHLLMEVGYNRVAGWCVFFWDSTGTRIADAPRIVHVEGCSDRASALELGAEKLKSLFPCLRTAQEVLDLVGGVDI